jgi:hypothetical protein
MTGKFFKKKPANSKAFKFIITRFDDEGFQYTYYLIGTMDVLKEELEKLHDKCEYVIEEI